MERDSDTGRFGGTSFRRPAGTATHPSTAPAMAPPSALSEASLLEPERCLKSFGAVCVRDVSAAVEVANYAHFRRPRWPRARVVIVIPGPGGAAGPVRSSSSVRSVPGSDGVAPFHGSVAEERTGASSRDRVPLPSVG